MSVFVYTAPKGGLIIQGRRFTEGQFVPQKYVAHMRPEEKIKLIAHEVKKGPGSGPPLKK